MNPAPPKFYYVYLVKSQKSNWIYIGCTSNLKKRLEEHKTGKSYSTSKHLPIDLTYYEAYTSKSDAYERERHLKQYGSSLQKLKARLRGILTQPIRNGLS